MRISLVVPNLNYGQYLYACLDSIQNQKNVEVEVFIVDGGSSDASIEIANGFISANNNWRLIVRPDLGQIAAIQLGLNLASGDIFGYLNSDDHYLTDDALRFVLSKFEGNPKLRLYSAGGCYTDKNGKVLRPCKLLHHPGVKDNPIKRGGGFVQPATFWKREVQESILMDRTLRYSFDTDFFLRAAERYGVLCEQNFLIAGYRLHGANLSLQMSSKAISELISINLRLGKGKASIMYLEVLAYIFRSLEKLPKTLSHILKRAVTLMAKCISYITAYRIPSI